MIDVQLGKELLAAATGGRWSGHDDVTRAIVSPAIPNENLLGLDVDGLAIVTREADHALLVWLQNNAAELLSIAEATRIRVTAEEPPEGDGLCLTWPSFLTTPMILESRYVRGAPRAYPHWRPLPERPAR
jgi:hypothetical protein